MLLAKATKPQPETFPRENYHEDKGPKQRNSKLRWNTERIGGFQSV